ncbi:MAG: nitroreductase family protein [Negativicutes bacterium]|jgi:nitroreductase
MISELIKKNRSYRRYYEDEKISNETLLELVDNARLSPTGGNTQPLRYFLAYDEDTVEKIHPTLAWAGYLKEWPGPDKGERPPAYIIILKDKDIPMVAGVDHGIAAQSILLGAVEKGLGGCILASVQRQKLADALRIADKYEILFVLSIGKPKETVVIDEVELDQDIKYWRDEAQVHHVPKRKLKDIVING